MEAATSESSKEQLQEELKARQSKLDDLMAGFEVRLWLLCWGFVHSTNSCALVC